MFRDVRNASEGKTETVHFYKKTIMLTNKKYSGKSSFQLYKHSLYFLAQNESLKSVYKLNLQPLAGYQKQPDKLGDMWNNLSHVSVLDLEAEPVDFLVLKETLFVQLKFGLRAYSLPTRNIDLNRKPFAKFTLPMIKDQDTTLRGWFAHSRDIVMNTLATYKYVLLNTFARLVLLSAKSLTLLSELQEPKSPLHYQILKSVVLRRCHFWLGVHQESLDIFANLGDTLTKVKSISLGNEFEKNILLHCLYFNQKSRELIISGEDGFMKQLRFHLARN